MAEQLRTLKDMTLNCECYFCQGLGGEECYVRIKLSELKDEARKWLNEMNRKINEDGNGFFCIKCKTTNKNKCICNDGHYNLFEDDLENDREIMIVSSFIRHFFNLEDNDDTKP